MNGSWAEAQESFATLEDVDEGTFVRFIEWAHKGCYTAAKHKDTEVSLAYKNEEPDEGFPPSPVNFDFGSTLVTEPTPEPPEPPEPEIPEETVNDWGQSWGTFGKGKKGKKIAKIVRDIKGELKEAYMSRKYTVRPGGPGSPPRHNMNPGEDYTDVFLSHARLYVFAAKWLIQPLRVLALEELHATLAAYTLYPERTGDILDLLRYFYPNASESWEGLEDMRAVMMQYVGYEMETLIECEGFKKLIIENGGELLGDFMTIVKRRIS